MELLVNVTVSILLTATKSEVGSADTIIKFSNIISSVPAGAVTTKDTSKIPAVLYVTKGFCSVLVAGVPPSNVHSQPVTLSEEASVNCTSSPSHTSGSITKALADGSELTLTISINIASPHSLVAVSVTV